MLRGQTIRPRVLHRRLDRRIAITGRIGSEFEITKIKTATCSRLQATVNLADDIGMWQAHVLEEERGVLIKTPSRFIKHFGMTEARRAARQQKHRVAFA